MIPKIIHQTWKSADLPAGPGDPGSWRRLNPDWEWRLWTDEALDNLIAEQYPDFLALYRSYPNPVQRADLGRYCLLHRFGGLYADIDTTCLSSLAPFEREDRIIICEEPEERWQAAQRRGMDRLYFNGTLASPAGHPFWQHVIDLCVRARHGAAKDVLESTGPLVLSAAVSSWPSRSDLALHSCHLFAPEDRDSGAERRGEYAATTISRHHWAGTWFRDRQPPKRGISGMIRQVRHLATRGRYLSQGALAAGLDMGMLRAPLPESSDAGNVTIFVPVRDGARTLTDNFAQIAALDYPRDRLSIVYCEGDSVDGSPSIIQKLIDDHQGPYRRMRLIHHRTGQTHSRDKRWHPKLQRRRRAAIAAVRNAMIDQALESDDDWVLWLDCDICAFAPDTLRRLLAERRKIVVPDCVVESGSPSFDLNTFLEVPGTPKQKYYKHVRDGLFQPPAEFWYRRHLHDLRYLDRVEVHSVGGTMLLVHGSVHRAGLKFPELPYRELIETEAFGRAAHDLGIPALALPNLEIRHVPN